MAKQCRTKARSSIKAGSMIGAGEYHSACCLELTIALKSFGHERGAGWNKSDTLALAAPGGASHVCQSTSS